MGIEEDTSSGVHFLDFGEGNSESDLGVVRDGGHANRCSGAVARDGNWDDIWIKLEGSYVKERGSTITRAIRARVSRIALADTASTNSFSVARSCQARASGVTF